MVAIAIPAAALAFGVRARRRAGTRSSGNRGGLTVNKKANAVSNIHFRTETGPETANCSETTPDLGKVATTARGSYPITLDRENGYQVWIVGKVDKTAYHGVAEIPAKFKIKAANKTVRGSLDMIFDYEDPATTELDAPFDGCTLYLLTFKHKN